MTDDTSKPALDSNLHLDGGPKGVIDASFLRECVDDAQEAINGLWDENVGTFWRSTRHRARETDKNDVADFYPTVSLRCISAMVALHGEAPAWVLPTTAQRLTNVYIQALVSRTVDDLRSSTLVIKNQDEPNIFTLSLYVQTMSRIIAYGRLADDSLGAIHTNLESGLRELVRHSVFAESPTVSLHPFLSYHAKRALVGGSHRITDKTLLSHINRIVSGVDEHCRDAIARNLAKYKLGSLNPGEAVALAFCAATLSGSQSPSGRQGLDTRSGVSREDRQAVLAAISVCLDSQDSSGCWPLSRVVHSEDKDIDGARLEITPFEVADAVADAATGILRSSLENFDASADRIVRFAAKCLLRSGRYAERSVVRLTGETLPQVGWCSEHAYGSSIIESWASATVLESALRLDAFTREFNRVEVMSNFATTNPTDRDWPQWLRWKVYRKEGEVDHDFPILNYLDRHIVQPVLADPRGLPPVEPRSVSVLLFGPPGTSKTTIVRGVADGLGWPLVMLSPGKFIERGLEYIEAQSQYVFDHLMQLSRAVVLFDECDELFRDRTPRAESEQTRGITAFVTASMLPKLQELHDRGSVIFFICTNNFHAMDPAVKRGGRLDHIIGVGPPDMKARMIIINSALKARRDSDNWQEPNYLEEAVDELASKTSRFTRPELSRAVIALASIGCRDKWQDEEAARTTAGLLVEGRVDSLTITQEEYDSFVKQRRISSHPYTEGM